MKPTSSQQNITWITLRVDKITAKAIKFQAETERRTVSDLIRLILQDYLKRSDSQESQHNKAKR